MSVSSAGQTGEKLAIKLSRQEYANNENVIGEVILRVTRESMNIEKVLVMIHGTISATSPTSQKSVSKQHYNKSAILQISKRIVERGEYNFPFSFELEKDIPPSFNTTEATEGMTTSVSYYLQAEVVRPPLATMAVRGQLLISKLVPADAASTPVAKEVHRSNRCCFCISRGKADFVAEVPSCSYQSEQSVMLSVRLENESTTEAFSQIKSRLVRRMSSAQPSESAETEVLPTQTLSIDRQSFTGSIMFLLPRKTVPSIRTELFKNEYRIMIDVLVQRGIPIHVELPIDIEK